MFKGVEICDILFEEIGKIKTDNIRGFKREVKYDFIRREKEMAVPGSAVHVHQIHSKRGEAYHKQGIVQNC